MADAPASPGGGSHESGEQSPRSNVREQDRFLPIANISRIMKKALPANGKIAKDAKETVQECVSEFISFITSEYGSISMINCCSIWLELFLVNFPFSMFRILGIFLFPMVELFLGQVINVKERNGRRLMEMIYFGPWPLLDLRIISIHLKPT